MAGFLKFYRIFEPVRQYLGVFLNCLLIFCILRRSPDNIARYSFLLLNGAISDLLTCLFSLYVEPRLIHYLDGGYYICYGFCKYTGFRSCISGYHLTFLPPKFLEILHNHYVLWELAHSPAGFVYLPLVYPLLWFPFKETDHRPDKPADQP